MRLNKSATFAARSAAGTVRRMEPLTDRATYTEQAPIGPLNGWVSSVWIQQVGATAPPYTQRTLPTGAVDLVCRLGSMPRILGPLTRPVMETLAPASTLVGLRFLPGAATPALGLPASEIVDINVGADAVWPSEAPILAERLAGSTPEDACVTLQGHVARMLRAGSEADPLMAEVVRRLSPWARGSVADVARRLFISERHLRRRCQTVVGLPPKQLQRTLRFQGFLALVQHTVAARSVPGENGLARLAAEAGYADQAHLSRECREFTGASPAAFVRTAACTCPDHDHTVAFTSVLRRYPGMKTRAPGQVLERRRGPSPGPFALDISSAPAST